MYDIAIKIKREDRCTSSSSYVKKNQREHGEGERRTWNTIYRGIEGIIGVCLGCEYDGKAMRKVAAKVILVH